MGDVIPFPVKKKENPTMTLLKHALFVAAIIIAVNYLNSATGSKLNTLVPAA